MSYPEGISVFLYPNQTIFGSRKGNIMKKIKPFRDTGGKLSQEGFLKKLGIPGFNFHMLRHIFATNCISQGFDMKTLSELLGHSNVGTTMRIYVHSDMERKKMLMSGYKMAA